MQFEYAIITIRKLQRVEAGLVEHASFLRLFLKLRSANSK